VQPLPHSDDERDEQRALTILSFLNAAGASALGAFLLEGPSGAAASAALQLSGQSILDALKNRHLTKRFQCMEATLAIARERSGTEAEQFLQAVTSTIEIEELTVAALHATGARIDDKEYLLGQIIANAVKDHHCIHHEEILIDTINMLTRPQVVVMQTLSETRFERRAEAQVDYWYEDILREKILGMGPGITALLRALESCGVAFAGSRGSGLFGSSAPSAPQYVAWQLTDHGRSVLQRLVEARDARLHHQRGPRGGITT